VAATFRSLVTTARLQATIARSLFPACCFFATPILPGIRSAGSSPSSNGLQPPESGSSRPARFPFRNRRFRMFLGVPLPFGAFRPFRIKAFNPIRHRKTHLPAPPDCSSLPAADSIKTNCGSPFRTRYVSGEPLFLETSWNHLDDEPGGNSGQDVSQRNCTINGQNMAAVQKPGDR
jgi:hypothetical protein